MSYADFLNKRFAAIDWESEVKGFIDALPSTLSHVWYRTNRKLGRISEELITLGYYVKYRYGLDADIGFRLNESQDSMHVDGWVLHCTKEIESVQIVIAYYEEIDAKLDDDSFFSDAECDGGAEYDRMKMLLGRIEQRIDRKVKKGYPSIDTLVVGTKGSFVSRVMKDYPDIAKDLQRIAEANIPHSAFKKLAIVDSDLVYAGGLWMFSN